MHLHELIPNISYDNGKYIFNDIFFKFYLKTPIEEKYLQVYTLSDGQSLEEVSFELYDDSIYFWILIIINDINDYLFELPLPEDSIQEIAKDMATINKALDNALYLEIYDQLSDENDSKRNIKVIKPQYLNQFLTKIVRESENNQ